MLKLTQYTVFSEEPNSTLKASRVKKRKTTKTRQNEIRK